MLRYASGPPLSAAACSVLGGRFRCQPDEALPVRILQWRDEEKTRHIGKIRKYTRVVKLDKCLGPQPTMDACYGATVRVALNGCPDLTTCTSLQAINFEQTSDTIGRIHTCFCSAVGVTSICDAVKLASNRVERMVIVFCFFFSHPPADGGKKSFSSPHFNVFSYASCVDLTQLLSQPIASWRTLRVPL